MMVDVLDDHTGKRRPLACLGRRTGLGILIGLLGCGLVIHGAWIPIKARVAQHLIARAWHRTLAGEERTRPWPWADTWPVARLHVPGIDRPLYALSGASGASLAFGPGHVSASAPPGVADNIAFAGHRDTHFAALEHLSVGAHIILETAATSTRYRVEAIEVVHESRVDLLERTGRAELTLITCYPFEAIVPGGPLRYVVHAHATAEPNT